MSKFLAAIMASAVICAVSGQASASVVDFESSYSSIFNSSGVALGTSSISPGSGYDRMVAYTGTSRFVYNPNEASPSTFTLKGASNATFHLNSFLIAGAWGTQTLTINGYNDGVSLFSQTVGVSLTPILFSADWSGIDTLEIVTGANYQMSPGLTGYGRHWVMDNLTINEAHVPEPASLLLVGLGVAGVAFARRKKVA